jgi:hypothetical protein
MSSIHLSLNCYYNIPIIYHGKKIYAYLSSQNMKSLVIGGSGFIGRNIIELLNRKGHYTVSYDIAKKDNDANEHINGNISDYDKLNNSMKGIDYVFNLAA